MKGFRDHRGFAACWDWSTRHESQRERELREEVAAAVSGRVLEIGVGVGANWEYLPADTDYVGIEPDAYMLARARARAAAAGRQWNVEEARAEALPFANASFDSTLVTMTLCTVQDVPRALGELRRVLKPNGRLVFMEHVRPAGKVAGPLMDALTPAWRLAVGGCHPNRRTEATIAAAGFTMERLERGRVNGLPFIWGTARLD
jgi:ubiquinone/menaquinone biosynthesis C-methylase UbiE